MRYNPRLWNMISRVILITHVAVGLCACANQDEGIANNNNTADVPVESESGSTDEDGFVTEDSGDYDMKFELYTENSTVGDVLNDPDFDGFGRLLFPVDLSISNRMTLKQISNSSVYMWYSNIKAEKTVEIINYFKSERLKGNQIFYNIYSDQQIANDPTIRNTGIFFFRGEPGKEFAITNAGGGFYYVGAMHDSFPHALEIAKSSYNAFALIYRPGQAYEDLGQAISFIYDHGEELQVSRENYSLWGGSAGARMAAVLGNSTYLKRYTQRIDIPQSVAVIMQYTGYRQVSKSDAPTYSCVGTRDGIASWQTMKNRLDRLDSLGIPTEFHVYNGLSHGFGLGSGTVGDGWIYDAIAFWKRQIEK